MLESRRRPLPFPGSNVSRGRVARLIAGALLLAACGGGRSSNVVVRVGDQVLTTERLHGLLAKVPPSEADPYGLADAIAEGWLDLTLVAEAAARGATPADTGLEREALAPVRLTEHLRRLQNALTMERPPLAESELARIFEGDSLRLFQSILVRVPDWTDGRLVRSRQARADSIAALALAGAPFDRLAAQLSEADNVVSGGFEAPVTRQELPPQWRDSLWALPPGGLSPVLSTQDGFQLIRRPPFRQARAQLAAAWLRVAGAREDSVLADSLSAEAGLELLDTTAERLRGVLIDPDSLPPDTAWVVRFTDGGVSPTEAWLWMAALPDQVRLSLARGSAVSLDNAARALARNELLFRLARRRGIRVELGELTAARTAFERAASPIFLRFSAESDAGARSRMVDSIIGGVLTGAPFRQLPAGLAPALRRRTPHTFDRDALARVAREARYPRRRDSVTP